MSRILGRKYTLRLWLLAACVALQTVAPAAAIDLAQGLADVRGVAYDEVSNRLYFLEDRTHALKSLDLTPGCEAATPPFCVSTTVATGFYQPSDVAVNAAAGLAYVVESGEPALWRVDLKSRATTKIATGIGALSQIVLAPEMNSAYVTDYYGGTLRRVDLSTGVSSVLADRLFFPNGLAVNTDHTLAYVSEATKDYGRSVISEINLGTGARTRIVASSALGRYFSFLAWTDSSESALYALEQTLGIARILRVDLVTSTQTVVASFTSNCSPQCEEALYGLAVNPSGSGLYLGRGDKVIRVPLKALPAQRVFLSIGNVPTTNIDPDGYANTASFVHSPFGGTLDIFGNLTLLKTTYKADSYRILVSKTGTPGPPVPILASWTASHWNPNSKPPHYEPELVAPDPTNGRYSIPQDYQSALTAPFWSPTYLMMRWPTSDNGTYTLRIQIFSNGVNITNKIPMNQRTLTVRIDNTPPVADLQTIRHGGQDVSPCEIVQTTPNSFDFGLEASDANGHLLGYSLRAVWGRNQSATVLSDSYSSHVNEDGPHSWKNSSVLFLPSPGWEAKCNCAHTFTLQVSKRTINGYGYILSSSSYQSITINNTGNTCL